MYKNLYLIGNGFDRHHDISSSYSDYARWLERNYLMVYEDLVSYYEDLPDLWGRFEENLAELNIYEYAHNTAREHYPNFESDDFRDREYHEAEQTAEIQLTKLRDDILGTFSEWIDSLEEPNPSKKIPLDITNSFFINFNYTETLENLYGIHPSRIWHIHGQKGSNEGYELGHGTSRHDLEMRAKGNMPEPPDELDPEEYSDWYSSQYDPIVDQTMQETINQVAGLQKDVEGIIKRNWEKFEELKGVTRIFIYGLSSSSVDEPYLAEIIKQLAEFENVKWIISYFKDTISAKEFIRTHNINIENVQFVRLANLHSKKEQLLPLPELQEDIDWID